MSVFTKLFGRKRDEPDAAEETAAERGSPEPAASLSPPEPTPEPPPVAAPTLTPSASLTMVAMTGAEPVATPAAPKSAAPARPSPPRGEARKQQAPPAARTPPPLVPGRSLDRAVEAAVDAIIAPATATATAGGRNGGGHAGNGKRPGSGAGISTAADLAALHATYAELSVEYCAPVRNVMIEVRWGEPPVRWLELVRGSLGSLQVMAAEVELGELAAALQNFNDVVGTVIRSGRSTVDADLRRTLLEAYAPLIAGLPRAFDLEGERTRREPVILRCLLFMVPGMLPLAIDRCLAAGLTRIEAIVKSPPEDVASVTGLDLGLCRQLVELVRSEGRIGAGNPIEERQRLQSLLGQLVQAHQGYEAASASWGASSRTDKLRFREQRERLWLKLQLDLARLGEVERIDRLERLPIARRIEDLESYLRTPAPVGSARARGTAATATLTITEPNSPQGI